jgi:hypothetical protein
MRARSKSKRWSRAEAKNFFFDVLCVPVNPTHRVLPFMPASVPADMVNHASAVWESPTATVYSGPALNPSCFETIAPFIETGSSSHFQCEALRCAPQASGVGWRAKCVFVTPKKPARHAR